MNGVFSNLIPVILLIIFGYLIRKKEAIKPSTITDIKKIIINVSLPAILFVTFIDMNFKKEYFVVMAVIFIMLYIFYFVGVLANKIKFLNHPLTPFAATCFCFGLFGLSLYGTVFGMENLDKITVFGAGHELFIWLIYYNTLKFKFQDEKISLKLLKGVVKSPLLISVFVGISFNLLGFGVYFKEVQALKGVYTTIKYLADIGNPLILIIIGYDLRFDKKYMKQSAKFVIMRLIIILSIGYALKFLVIDKLIQPEPLFDYAYFTFLISPLPFSLPIFVSEYCEEYTELINNSVVLSTVVCMVMFIVFLLFI